MTAQGIAWTGVGVDLSGRWFENHTVAASPAAAVETIICTLPKLPRGVVLGKAVFLSANAAFTVGTNGTNGNLRIRQTDASGTVLYSTGGVTMTAATLVNLSGQGVDPSPAVDQVYVVTLTITAGTATSTVSAVSLFASII